MSPRIQVPLSMLFRLVAVLSIGGMIHHHHLRVIEEGQHPIRLSEVKVFLPQAHDLALAGDPGGGLQVVDATRSRIGYVARSMPHNRSIKGYSGPSDVLMAYDVDDKLLGVTIRHSYDTPSHVEDVVADYLFMERWNGLTRHEIAQMGDLKRSKVYGVSGATRTSEAVAQSVALRAGIGRDQAMAQVRHFRWQDGALVLVALAGLALTFIKQPLIQRRRFWIHLVIVLYLGLISGDLLAQSLLISWIEHGIPWRTLPGLVILVAVAFIIPWSTGKPTYCTHLCPHGQVQRWLTRWVPPKARFPLPRDIRWGLLALPGGLLILTLLVTFFKLPLDLAGIEPFDAWSIRNAGLATLVVAGLSLVFSAFVPMGYCRYACPTGLALNLVRRHSKGFGLRDAWLLGILLLSTLLYFGYATWKPWIAG
jgi:NosR/NirI family nitrous oxide reductase transcriptional regulator